MSIQRASDGEAFDTEVLVVGSGPAGATAALALATYGVDVIALNKYRSTAIDPRAHIFNQRSMEILRDFGLERDAMSVATPHDLMRHEIFCTSLTGRELSRFEAWHTRPDARAQHDLASPTTMVDLNQQLLEPLLVTEAARRGAHMRTETELVAFEQDANGVTSSLHDRLNGHDYTVRSQYLVGADGGNSRVMEQLGLSCSGQGGLATTVGITFRADLRHLMEHRSGELYWMVQAGEGIMGYGLGGLRMVRAWDRWVASWGHPTGAALPDEDAARALVHKLIGDETIAVEIENVKSWSINRLWAPTVSRDRVFLAGDAIHRHPPMNGLGSNTSMQDAFNLAWKLAMVLKEQAGPGLLESYQEERQPVAESMVERTVSNMLSFFPAAAETLGLRRGGQTSAEIDEQIAQLMAPTQDGERRRAAFREAIAGTVRASSAIGGEFNVRYRSSVVVDDGSDLTVDDPELTVIRGLESGRRLPHVWLTVAQQEVSSLDLCGHGAFVLFTGLRGERAWRAAIQEVEAYTGVAVTLRVVGTGGAVDDPYGEFARLCMPHETGAVLVRPDHVVAWHVDEVTTDHGLELQGALETALGYRRAAATETPVGRTLANARS